MRIAAFVFLLIGVVLSSDVLDLTDSTFKSQVEDKDIILVEFYAPWCGHCKRLAPEYETAATTLKSNEPPVPLAKVDCTEAGKDTCSKYGVSGYPTLKVFRSGTPSDYDGPREAGGIVSYMRKQAGPASTELKDEAHLHKRLADADENLVVGFFTSDNEFAKKFQKAAAQKRDDYVFVHTTDAELCKQAGHSDAVVMFRPKHLHAKFEPTEYVLAKGDASTYEITKFLDDNAIGLVGDMKPNNEAKFKKPLVVVYYNVDWKKDPTGSKYWRNRVARVAKDFSDLHFAVAAKSSYSRNLDDLGLHSSSEEVEVAAKNAKNQNFVMRDKFSVESLKTFASEFLEGKLKPYIKSEAVPESNDGPVKVVVGTTFDQIVNDDSKDVLIEFYAPWCGHCKTLEPKYAELGEKLKDVKDVVIAKMDATANDVPPPFSVSGFPTLYWAPMGRKSNPKKYEGGREVKDFLDFIKREATNPIELPSEEKKKKKKKQDEL